MRKGSGLANWDIFAAALLKVMRAYHAETGRYPGRRVLIRLGYQNLVFAAYHHHGGLVACRRRLGITEAEEPQRTVHLEAGVGRGKAPGPLANYVFFQAALRAAVAELRKVLRRYPVQDDLIAAGYRSIVQAAYRHHDGLRQEFRNIGIPIQPPRPRKKIGLAVWATFEAVARPLWADWLVKYGHLPSQRELFAAGHGRIVYAIRNHHGGFAKTHRRLGFQLHQMKGGKLSPFRWTLATQLTAIRRHFPEEVSWGYAPTTEAAKRINGGFMGSVKRTSGGWLAIIKAGDLMFHRRGRYNRRVVEVALWAIASYEQHRQWPSTADGPHLGVVQRPRRGQSWESWISQVNAQPLATNRLRDRLILHRDWVRRHEPNRLAQIQATVNQVLLRPTKAALSLDLLG